MSRFMPLITALAALGCAPRLYIQPTDTEPHAITTVRIVHHQVSGPQLAHSTTLDGLALGIDREAAVAGAPITRVIRVRPVATRWRFGSRFTHQVTETRMETVYRTERSPCGMQTTGYGASRRTSTRYCSRQVPHQELRTRTRTVVDGECHDGVLLIPQVGQRYMIQFDYYGHGQCRARCFLHYVQPDGSFRLASCGV